MTFYLVAISIHVLTAVLGVGQIMAMAVIVAAARGTSENSSHLGLLRRLGRWVTWRLLVMPLSAALILAAAGTGYAHTWWSRISSLLFLGLGALLGMTSVKIKKA